MGSDEDPAQSKINQSIRLLERTNYSIWHIKSTPKMLARIFFYKTFIQYLSHLGYWCMHSDRSLSSEIE